MTSASAGYRTTLHAGHGLAAISLSIDQP